MTKTAIDIERDFHAMASASALGQALRGSIYYDGERPADAKGEDMIVAMLSGFDGQRQTGTVIINIYVPGIPKGGRGRMIGDRPRIAELMSLINAFKETEGGAEYDILSGPTPTVSAVDGIDQHVIRARINFQRITL